MNGLAIFVGGSSVSAPFWELFAMWLLVRLCSIFLLNVCYCRFCCYVLSTHGRGGELRGDIPEKDKLKKRARFSPDGDQLQNAAPTRFPGNKLFWRIFLSGVVEVTWAKGLWLIA